MIIEGYVLKKVKYNDFDQIVTIISKNRFYTFLAKGTLKYTSKNRFSLNLYTKGEFLLFNTKEGLLLRRGVVKETFKYNDNLNLLIAMDFISEITLKLLANNEINHIYDYFINVIDGLTENSNHNATLLFYLCKILKITGYALNLDCCVYCNNKNNIEVLSLLDGGLICTNCVKNKKDNNFITSALYIDIVRKCFNMSYNDFIKEQIDSNDALNILVQLCIFVNDKCGYKIKSIKLITKL